MSTTSFVSTVTTATFVEEVIQRSASTPVLVDFWAPWCEPCKNLMPILESLATQYNGGFQLAKVNADEEQQIVAQAQIRSLPTVMLFINGQIVDQFMGALSESEIRAFLDKHISAPAADAEPASPIEQADALIEAGDQDAAYALLQSAQADDPSNPELLLKIAGIAVSRGDIDTVKSVLSILPEEAKNRSEAKQLEGLLSFAEANNKDLKTADLQADFDSGKLDPQGLYQLGVKKALDRDFNAASDAFFKLLISAPEFENGAAKTALLALFQLLGDDPLVGKLRRKMFALLH